MPTQNESKEWWSMGMRAMGNGIEESFGQCDREELEEYTLWLIAEAERRKVKEIRERIEKMRPFPFRPCPACGGELKLGSGGREMRFGCYNDKCERVKANNYFYIDMYDSLPIREGENMLIDRILDCLKDE